MALIRGRVNPLNVLELRRLTFIPENFARITSSRVENIGLIDRWIYDRLDSRFCVKKIYTLDQDNKMVEVLEIGIEDPKELSMFTLGCQHIQ